MTIRSIAARAAGGTAKSRSIVNLYNQMPISIEYLIVAGGGSGGGSHAGGGGGAGGYRSSVSGENSGGGASSEATFSALMSTNYVITVGAGGTAANQSIGTSGSNSLFGSIVSIGGGAGASESSGMAPLSGGSGGGGSGINDANAANRTGASGTSGQGYAGGNGNNNVASRYGVGAGGGGGSAVGVNAGTNGGAGGNGVSSSITGTPTDRAGGGGGGGWPLYSRLGGAGGTGGGGAGSSSENVAGTAGTANTGGGGGGSSANGTTRIGGNGGSGVVILKYPASLTATFSAGVTESTSTSGDFKVSEITATSTTSETVSFIEETTPEPSSVFPARYYKLVVDTIRGGGSDSYIQLSEFQLRENSTWLTGGTYTNGNGSSPSNEGPSLAGDNNTGTKWLNFTGASSILLITYASPVTVTDYTWWTANDGNWRDMTGWTLSASQDNETWVVIDQVSGFSPTTSRFTNVGTFNVDEGV